MTQLPQKAQDILSFIIQYQEAHGYSPSIAEMRDAAQLKSYRGVTINLDKLQKNGYISRESKIPRSIKILNRLSTNEHESSLRLPVLGEVHAGYFTLAEQNIEEYFDVSLALLYGRQDAFLLRIAGDSMLNAGFFPGDIAIVIPQSTASSGDIVIALNSDGDATMKRFKKIDNFIFLIPESPNPEYQPLIGQDFKIQGRVVGKLSSADSI